mmetsp:Transcript_16731/g.29266  ORF Transcript_16731/g.29266 Transcript_16731/m.29266 type:complete len:284 (+) Transcript_16731:75-926(+)|eukprot:CAMPEP_0197656598 /NCGR_PEP_ID=MMETSP1338-20131121/42551_1 /TAXON_ID=43686 ORGANISM="Pelagodinium beii, Strain RCC1491" /NCGR_SAMPLE_ID=MMETSP1338 /ASSEMBLY_ACC=CAM_ASM_000754 /LENGTH=283 /DNA_ID=CAMNT_0043232673 /DNA_START=75 /DNA_END=926 /DNA_ORIENTATION=+
MVPAVAVLLAVAVASEAPGHGVVEENAVDEICSASVSMLQRAAAPVANRGASRENAEEMLLQKQLTEAAELRREDAELRAYNLQLRRRLENMTSFLAVRIADVQRKHRQWKDLLQPVPMALLASGFSGLFYWTVKFSHFRAFYAKRRKILRDNGRGRNPQPLPDWEEFTETMQARFFRGISSWGVRALLSVFVLSITGASFLASRGYFEPLADKMVPFLFLGFVAALILMVFVREAKREVGTHFSPVVQALGQLSEFVEELGEDGPAALQKILVQQTTTALQG